MDKPDLNALIVYRPGDVVKIAVDVEATVQRVTLCAGHCVEYCCAWWHNGERKSEWITANEILPK